jgi:hypothetical protein
MIVVIADMNTPVPVIGYITTTHKNIVCFLQLMWSKCYRNFIDYKSKRNLILYTYLYFIEHFLL